MSSAPSTKYCGQVSAQTFSPRACARAISSATSGTRDVEHLDRLIHHLGERDRAIGRLALHHLGPRPRMILRRAAAVRHQRGGAPADRLVVLAVHRHQRAGASRRRQHADELAIVQMRRLVGQKHLQAAHARGNHLRDFVAHHAVRRIGDDLVEAVVHHRLLRPPMVLGQRVADAMTLELRGKGDDGGGAAGQARGAAGDETLLVRTAVRAQLLDVAVRIDAARHHVQPAGVQCVACPPASRRSRRCGHRARRHRRDTCRRPSPPCRRGSPGHSRPCTASGQMRELGR